MTGIGQLSISEKKKPNKLFNTGNVQNYFPNNNKIYYPTVDKKKKSLCSHSFPSEKQVKRKGPVTAPC